MYFSISTILFGVEKSLLNQFKGTCWLSSSSWTLSIFIYPFIILPYTWFYCSIWIYYPAFSWSLSFKPIPLKYSTIVPIISSKSILLVIFVMTSIFSPIFPFINALSMHHVVFPFPLINSSIEMPILSITINFSFFPFTIIQWIIWPTVGTFSFFLT